MCVCVRVCVHVRACVCACMRACVRACLHVCEWILENLTQVKVFIIPANSHIHCATHAHCRDGTTNRVGQVT